MATFYPTSTKQRDSMANLYLGDSAGHVLYPESTVSGNIAFLNYPSSVPYSEALVGSMQSQTNCIRNEMLFLQANVGSIDGGDELIRDTVGDDPQMGLQTQLGILHEHNLSLQQSKISSVQGQGLSLSLGTHIPVPSFKYQPAGSDASVLSSLQSVPGNGETYRDEISRSRISSAGVSAYGLTNITSTIPNSKYLEAAQQLLDEVVNVQMALKQKLDNCRSLNTSGIPACKDKDGLSNSNGNPSNQQESTANGSNDLSPSERQDLHNKVTNLLAMLDEIDRRYKQYYHQMQIVVSSFEAIAGPGSAKPYTALALQTISRHFRCLRDAINDQVRSTRKLLGEQDGSSGKGCGISRLRYIDQHVRQQRTMQQLGMMPQHAWRPQRGLPENSVSILRAWLFEHFLHPYPNDSEKLMLATQTGLTRSQVSNWFINARVRLWKPMVEDMYKEEFGETEMDSNSSSENATKSRDEPHSLDAQEDKPSPETDKFQANQSPNHAMISETNMPGGPPGFQNEPRDHRLHDSAGLSLLHNAIHHGEGTSSFMTYSMTELGRYGNGGVSLTLGLQHCEGNHPTSDDQQSFLAVRGF
ncbi:hypothetical protein HPP92_010069 [Vanilla planifolia]|uniref:Homeobox domain-containing protein n=1 Tax=Vanilla planifolia TaxID=51239 RepID=A0A835QY88_VANPL|nr:hypothetical protein HPP92_010069 [Vanilla planifolia]